MAENSKIRKKELFFLFVLIIFYFFLNFNLLFSPLNEKENKLTKIVTAIKEGSVPYKDISDNTPPVNYYIYLTAYKIFNLQSDHVSLRIFTVLYIMFFILLMYIVGRLMAGPAIAMTASFFYVIFMWKNPYAGIYSFPGLFAQFPFFLSLMFLFFIEKEYEKVDYFLSGFFLCVSSYIVYSIKFTIFIPVIYIFLWWKKQRDKLKYILWFISGFVFMELLAFLWAVKNSILKEFFQLYFINNMRGLSGNEGLKIKLKEIFINKNYLLFMFICVLEICRMFIVKKFDYNFILLPVSILLFIFLLFEKRGDIGYYYLLVPFVSVMLAFLIKNMVLQIIRKNY